MRATEAVPAAARRRCAAWLGAGLATALLPAPRPLAAQAVAEPAALGRPWRLAPGAAVEVRAGGDGADLATVLDGVLAWSVPAGARLVIQLADGDHPLRAPVVWRHPDGARIVLRGRPADPSRCRLLWAVPGDGIYVGAGQVLGRIEGLSLVQTAAGGAGSGLLADEGGALQCGPGVRVDGFYYGVQARRNGAARCDEVAVTGAGDAGFFAFMGGHVHARAALATGSRDDAQRLGSGFVAEYGGSIDAEGATARLNALDGFTALSNGAIRAYRARAERNGRSGYFTDTGGRIVGHDAVAEGNCGDGVLVRDAGRGFTGERFSAVRNNAASDTCRSR